jgi:UDP-N-acetylglucosamine diphosphorylase / glucose-1-phosphate thymidylyltransferase / UDP-N-acetylgalactosamine diphosphorylase / glucosamine-1-phosphate N-acetyltransferase / galactosamine-1-phosphate N-acetyltransferase
MQEWYPLIVIPMAGRGLRFRVAGFDRPKPLIDVAGRPMYAWAVDSLPLQYARELVFVVLRTQEFITDLVEDITQRYAEFHPRIEYVPEVTRGQAETALAALGEGNDVPLLIHNADTSFVVDDLWIRRVYDTRQDGALLVFPSQEGRWSYSRTGKDGSVVEVREKQVISEWASTGSYWFRSTMRFRSLVDRDKRANGGLSGELYVAPLYNHLIQEGGRVTNVPVDEMACFGTPEDLLGNLGKVGMLRRKTER